MEFVEKTGKTVDDAITEALIAIGLTSDKVNIEVLDEGSKGLLGFINSRPAKVRVSKKNTVKDVAINFLEDVFDKMNLQVDIKIDYNEKDNVLDIDLSGKDMGAIIGKRGQTLDSLQYLTGLVVNKHVESYVKIKMDSENYRDRRRDTLENLAHSLANKVRKTRRPVFLEPMNPFERRIIHSALQGDKFVETHSEGDEPFRKVVITLKKNY